MGGKIEGKSKIEKVKVDPAWIDEQRAFLVRWAALEAEEKEEGNKVSTREAAPAREWSLQGSRWVKQTELVSEASGIRDTTSQTILKGDADDPEVKLEMKVKDGKWLPRFTDKVTKDILEPPFQTSMVTDEKRIKAGMAAPIVKGAVKAKEGKKLPRFTGKMTSGKHDKTYQSTLQGDAEPEVMVTVEVKEGKEMPRFIDHGN